MAMQLGDLRRIRNSRSVPQKQERSMQNRTISNKGVSEGKIKTDTE